MNKRKDDVGPLVYNWKWMCVDWYGEKKIGGVEDYALLLKCPLSYKK